MFFYKTISEKRLNEIATISDSEKFLQKENIRNILSRHFEELYRSLPAPLEISASRGALIRTKHPTEKHHRIKRVGSDSNFHLLCQDCDEEMIQYAKEGVGKYICKSNRDEVLHCAFCGLISPNLHDILYHIALKHGILDRCKFNLKKSSLRKIFQLPKKPPTTLIPHITPSQPESMLDMRLRSQYPHKCQTKSTFSQKIGKHLFWIRKRKKSVKPLTITIE